VLKVDRSFIAQLQEESNERELTRTIVQLGGSLEMLTVAEGVETQAQLDTLRTLGCDLAQGFLFSEPRPAAEVEAMLAGAPLLATVETTDAEITAADIVAADIEPTDIEPTDIDPEVAAAG
jgi:predicted signal transduction protein with EAL and GGDEF domain